MVQPEDPAFAPEPSDGTKARPSKPMLVIVTPVRNESGGLTAYRDAVERVLFNNNEIDVEVILVDDGSGDDSWRQILALSKADDRFRGIRLSRNFGAHVAIAAGLHAADGDAVAILAADLQDPAEVIPDFLAAWRRGADIVWGHRESRQEGLLRQRLARAYVWLLREFAMPDKSQFTTGSFLLMDRMVVDCYKQYRDHQPITFALVAWTGFDQAVITYHRRERTAGHSKWTPLRILRTVYDTLIGFSSIPTRLVTGIGVALFAFSCVFSVYLLINWFAGDPLAGWTTTTLIMLFFFGVQFLIFGVMGEYLKRIFQQSAGRPVYFVSERSPTSDEPRQ